MPLRFDIEKYLGTNSDGSRSDEYCYYCLKDGKYIVDIPMTEMINIWIKYTDKYNNFIAAHANKIFIMKLQVCLGRDRYLLQVFYGFSAMRPFSLPDA